MTGPAGYWMPCSLIVAWMPHAGLNTLVSGLSSVSPTPLAGRRPSRRSFCWAPASKPGPLPAKEFMKPNRTVAPELDWVGLVIQTFVLPDSTAVRMSPICTSPRPVKPSLSISLFQPANTIGVRNIGLRSCRMSLRSPIWEKTLEANQ
jgi:hypothetical protein